MDKTILKLGIKLITALIIVSSSFISCDRNEAGPIATDTVQLVKEFVYEITRDYYLWEEYIPGGININDYSDPFKLFEKMYYPTLDKWSFVTDDYEGLQNSLDGIRKAAGFKYQPFRYSVDSDDLFLLIDYVHTDGEAYKAGLERGDVIITVNGTTPTVSNYYDLISQDVLEFKIGELQDDQVVDLNETIVVTKKEQSFNPILQYQVIETGGKKIGYFLYDQFISDYDTEMINVISSFDAAGIDELVLDLRYNPGGYVSTCAKLGSMIVPAVNLDDIFLTYQWNDIVTNAWKDNPDNAHLFTLNFPETSVNLNLSTLYVLCSERSASASEAIINCLRPYMNVVLIGTQTSGKYTSVNVFYDNKPPTDHNWAVFLVTSRIANADGVTDYINGFTPDHVVEDDFITPHGDVTEPLLAKAIDLITGSITKSSKKLPEQFDRIAPFYENWMEREGIMINDLVKLPEK